MKLYIFGPKNLKEGIYHIITEEGELLVSQYCNDTTTILNNSKKYKSEWKKRFGKYTIENIENQTEISRKEIVEKNKKYYEVIIDKGEL